MGIAEVAGLTPRPGATQANIEEAERLLGHYFPEDYRLFLSETDGLEGFVAPNAYLILWPAADLAKLNAAYSVREHAPSLVLFGTDGGDTAYGFRTKAEKTDYVRVPLIGLSDGAAELIGSSLTELIGYLKGAPSRPP
jgi:hypothetical protein